MQTCHMKMQRISREELNNFDSSLGGVTRNDIKMRNLSISLTS